MALQWVIGKKVNWNELKGEWKMRMGHGKFSPFLEGRVLRRREENSGSCWRGQGLGSFFVCLFAFFKMGDSKACLCTDQVENVKMMRQIRNMTFAEVKSFKYYYCGNK